jgi:putative DNA primase/helicase
MNSDRSGVAIAERPPTATGGDVGNEAVRDAPAPPGNQTTALATARWALDAGLWPIAITAPDDKMAKSPGKQPIGRAWAAERHDVQWFQATYRRYPKAGIGLKLGADGGVVDIDIDQPELAGPVLARIFPGGPPETLGWQNEGGRFHLLFLWDDRLVRYGKSIIKGGTHYPGLEIRIGTGAHDGKQFQSVIPPSRMANGRARRWNGNPAILPLPESFFADLDAHTSPTATAVQGRPVERPATPTAAPVAPPRRGSAGGNGRRPTAEERAVKYLKSCPPAIQGNDGSGQTLKVCIAVGPGFDLPEDVAYRLILEHYNPRCVPVWLEKDLLRKVKEAYRVEPRRGFKLDVNGRNGTGGQDHSGNGNGRISAPPAEVPPPSLHGDEGDPIRPNEGQADPHRLARVFVRTKARNRDGLTIRFWMSEWHRWDGSAYRTCAEKEIRAQVTKVIKAEFNRINREELRNYVATAEAPTPPTVRPVTTRLVSDVIQALTGIALLGSRECVEQPSWLDGPAPFPANETLPAKNVLVHISSLAQGRPALHPPTPRFFCRYALDYDYRSDAPTPVNWLKFLGQLWPDDPQSLDTLQEWMGLNLLPYTQYQKIFVLIGPKRSGKGTIARILTALVGRENVANPTLHSLGMQFGKAPLIGKLSAIISDAQLSGRTDVAQVVESLLTISGEDGQTIDRKHLAAWIGKLFARFTLISNSIPRLTESAGAMAGRVILLRLTRTFFGEEDPDLMEKLLPELPGILLWAIEGLRRLIKRGRFVQPDSGQPLVEEMEDLASPVGMFVKECCEVAPDRQTRVSEVFARWKAWCAEKNREQVGDEPAFGRQLRSVVPALNTKAVKSKDGYYRVFEGIALVVSPSAFC